MLTTPMAIVYQTTTELFRLEQKALWSSPSGGLHPETHRGWEGTSSWHPTGNPFKVPTHESIFRRSCQQAWSLSKFILPPFLPEFCKPKISSKRLANFCSNHKVLWCPIKMRVFHQNESCLSCLHPPSCYEGRREQGRQLSFCQNDFDEELSIW